MCNTFVQRPKKNAEGWQVRLRDAIAELKRPLIRKSDPAIVVVRSDDDLSPRLMRWGFYRSFNSAISNARTDKLTGPIWSEAFRERRCLIPASSFYEWSPTPRGPKQAYEFRAPEDDWLWIAGLWENAPQFGECFTMLTTDAPPVMASIHDRMPAILDLAPALAFLSGEYSNVVPYTGSLAVRACDSPLKTKAIPPPDDPQGLLF